MSDRLFLLEFNRADWYRYQVEGEHSVTLPALLCDACGYTWMSTGEAYPTVTLDTVFGSALHERRVMSLPEFELLRKQLHPRLPEGALLKPGASLGPFVGKAKGRFFDFVWPESWTLFVQREAWGKLEERGVRLGNAAAPDLRAVGATVLPELMEPEAPPRIPLSLEGFTGKEPPCAACGRREGKFTEFLLDSDVSAPSDLDLFRASNNTALLIVTERFARAAEELELTGYRLEELRRVTSEQ